MRMVVDLPPAEADEQQRDRSEQGEHGQRQHGCDLPMTNRAGPCRPVTGASPCLARSMRHTDSRPPRQTRAALAPGRHAPALFSDLTAPGRSRCGTRSGGCCTPAATRRSR
jgi:hypothetical protein